MKEGIVVKSTGSWYLVRLEDERTVECRIRGKSGLPILLLSGIRWKWKKMG